MTRKSVEEIFSISMTNKETSRLYAELCEPMLKFFILVSQNEPDR